MWLKRLWMNWKMKRDTFEQRFRTFLEIWKKSIWRNFFQNIADFLESFFMTFFVHMSEISMTKFINKNVSNSWSHLAKCSILLHFSWAQIGHYTDQSLFSATFFRQSEARYHFKVPKMLLSKSVNSWSQLVEMLKSVAFLLTSNRPLYSSKLVFCNRFQAFWR